MRCLRCGPLIKAIDAYLAKAENDLYEQLTMEGYLKAKESLNTVDEIEEVVTKLLEDNADDLLKELADAIDLETLRYTQRATRIVTDDISRSDARKIIQKVAALEDVRDIQKVCGTAVHALDTRDREGFSKSTFRLYGEGIRLTARQILLDAHAANNVNFQTDYDKRIEKIGAVVDSCSLLLEYLTICTEEGIISAKKAGIWTKKVTDVKYPAMKWLTSERGRAEKLRAEAERKRLTEQAAALKAVLYPEP